MKISAAFVSLALSLGLVNAQISLSPAPGTVISSCNRPGVIALTFDDGPGPDMSRLVDTLDAAGAKATFFVTGTLYGCIYNRADFVRKAYNSGHQIASHTWSHPNMGSYSTQQIQTEMKRLEQALVNILGVRPTYMRAPYLAAGGNVPNYMRGDYYRIIQTDVDTQDWNNISAQQSFQRLQQAGASGNGHIPLMHETVSTTPSQLAPLVINWAKQNNLRMVTVAECLGDSTPYINGAGGGQQNCNAAYTPGTTGSGPIPTPTQGGGGNPNPNPQPTPTPTPQPNPGTNCAARWGQCGGQGWNGPTCCREGTCRQSNQWYSQCQ